MLFKFLILSVFVISYAEKVRYDNWALYKVHPESGEHIKFLNDLEDENYGLDFWKSVSQVGDYASIVSPPEMRENFEHSLSKRSIRSELMLSNIQEAFDAQLFSRRKRNAFNQPQLFWTNYQTIDEINAWFNYLASNHSDIVSLINIGQSHEGKNIIGIKISRGNTGRNFILEGGQLGADWLSPTVLTYIADQLVRGEDPEALAASRDFDWHIFPIINPDGFQFSQDSVRLWTKNRRPTRDNQVGVDLTRNWNSQWGVRGASFTPVASNFVGLGPFSELETRHFSRYIASIGNSTTGFLSFRAFGQRLLIPFAHSNEPLYNFNEMVTVFRRAMGSLAVRYGTQYLVGTSGQVHNGATGMIADWVKFRFNPTIAATFLLRDQGGFGFTLPVNQILPSCEETFDSLMAMFREARFIDVL